MPIRPHVLLPCLLALAPLMLAPRVSRAEEPATADLPRQVAANPPALADVFVPQTDGFVAIRIPSVVVSRHGVVIAFAEGRAANSDQAKNKIIMKRSLDGGQSWSPRSIIARRGAAPLNNPCALVERESGRILLMFQSYPPNLGEGSDKIEPGHVGDFIVRNWLITSDDEGQSWSPPRDITSQTKRPTRITTIASGPGLGIQLRHGPHAGRILFPLNEGPYGAWNIYAVWSDDGGETWNMGEVAPGGLADTKQGKPASTVNEAQFVELEDGEIRFNVRRWSGKPLRKTSVSHDGGATWSKVEDIAELMDPSCMGSVLRYTDPTDGRKSRLLYSGPQSARRENGAIFVSYDEGATWPTKRVLCPGSFGYSCLVALPDGSLGCLYEADGARRIVFARFTLGWLTASSDAFEAARRRSAP